MNISFLDLVTLISYGALAADFILQIHKVWARKHSGDISTTGVVIRTSAAAVILVKFFVVGDWFLIIGQVALVFLLCVYLGLVIRYRNVV